MPFPTTHPALALALAARGYDVPTAVQLAVLGDDAAGCDLLVSAQTGSGKTVAFGLALGSTLMGDAERLPPAVAVPLALIIAPTRELAMQVCRELQWLYEATGARVITCVGGMDARAEARQIEAGPHIVVGTPGRLRDHLERRRLDLSGLRAVVLDEADEMLDLGFREDLEFILDATPAERRTLLFSATLPREIEALARRYQQDAVRIETLRRDEQHADIDYWAHRVVPHDVENTVVNVLRFHEAKAALVFCATREAVNRLTARLIERGFSAVALSGELTQHERTQALQALRDGRARVLVATDVAARGLDLPELAVVVHAELPNDGETLLHRSGRTGRAGRKGLSVLVVPYNRRRKADALIGDARLHVTWRPAPMPEEIHARDQQRFLADPSFVQPASEDEALLARTLQDARSAEEIALALVRLHRAQLPAPEDLTVDRGPPPYRERNARATKSRDWQPRGERTEHPKPPWRRDDAQSASSNDAGPHQRRHDVHERSADPAPRDARRFDDARLPKPRRADARPMTWFRINIGRNRNADPRWLLPLICRAGGVTKSEIGTIRVEDRETRFQILAEVADRFDVHARTLKEKEGHIVRADPATTGSFAALPSEPIPSPVETKAFKKKAPLMQPARKPGKWEHKATGKGAKGAWRNRSEPDAPGSGRQDRGRKGKPPNGPGTQPSAGPADVGSRRPSKFAKKKKH